MYNTTQASYNGTIVQSNVYVVRTMDGWMDGWMHASMSGI